MKNHHLISLFFIAATVVIGAEENRLKRGFGDELRENFDSNDGISWFEDDQDENGEDLEELANKNGGVFFGENLPGAIFSGTKKDAVFKEAVEELNQGGDPERFRFSIPEDTVHSEEDDTDNKELNDKLAAYDTKYAKVQQYQDEVQNKKKIVQKLQKVSQERKQDLKKTLEKFDDSQQVAWSKLQQAGAVGNQVAALTAALVSAQAEAEDAEKRAKNAAVSVWEYQKRVQDAELFAKQAFEKYYAAMYELNDSQRHITPQATHRTTLVSKIDQVAVNSQTALTDLFALETLKMREYQQNVTKH